MPLWRLEPGPQQCHLSLNLPLSMTSKRLPPTATCHPPPHINPSIFPVIMGPNATAPSWVPTPLTGLALIRKAANESGPDYPYFEQVIRQYATAASNPLRLALSVKGFSWSLSFPPVKLSLRWCSRDPSPCKLAIWTKYYPRHAYWPWTIRWLYMTIYNWPVCLLPISIWPSLQCPQIICAPGECGLFLQPYSTDYGNICWFFDSSYHCHLKAHPVWLHQRYSY